LKSDFLSIYYPETVFYGNIQQETGMADSGERMAI
jgi:hypothetical protein